MATSLPLLCCRYHMVLLDWIMQTSLGFMLFPVSGSAVRNHGILKETLRLLYRLKHLGVLEVRYK